MVSSKRFCNSSCKRPVTHVLIKWSSACTSYVCAFVCVSEQGKGLFFPPPFFSSLFSPGKSLMPSLFTKFSFGVVRILLHATDSLMFLKLTKLLWASFSLFSTMYLNLFFSTCPNYCWESEREVWTQTARNSAYYLSFMAGTHLTIFWWVFAATGSIQAVFYFELARSLEINIIGVLERDSYSEVFLKSNKESHEKDNLVVLNTISLISIRHSSNLHQ